jgi:hypothetical protein
VAAAVTVVAAVPAAVVVADVNCPEGHHHAGRAVREWPPSSSGPAPSADRPDDGPMTVPDRLAALDPGESTIVGLLPETGGSPWAV